MASTISNASHVLVEKNSFRLTSHDIPGVHRFFQIAGDGLHGDDSAAGTVRATLASRCRHGGKVIFTDDVRLIWKGEPQSNCRETHFNTDEKALPS
jgi:hypothetical protein